MCVCVCDERIYTILGEATNSWVVVVAIIEHKTQGESEIVSFQKPKRTEKLTHTIVDSINRLYQSFWLISLSLSLSLTRLAMISPFPLLLEPLISRSRCVNAPTQMFLPGGSVSGINKPTTMMIVIGLNLN